MKAVLIAAAIAILGFAASPAGAQAGCAVPGNGAALQSALAQQINAFRAARSLAPLSANPRLAHAALAHACDAARTGRMDHRGSDGSNSQGRVRAAGYRDCLVAENLAWGYPQPGQILSGWANSSGHRRNMLLQRAEDYGVGVAMGARGPIWVMVYARSC